MSANYGDQLLALPEEQRTYHMDKVCHAKSSTTLEMFVFRHDNPWQVQPGWNVQARYYPHEPKHTHVKYYDATHSDFHEALRDYLQQIRRALTPFPHMFV